jgi:hypothetical protein
LVLLIPVILVLAMAEVLLRLNPSLIGLALLDRFPAALKSSIASSLGLPSKTEYDVIPSASRHDKGSDLYLALPNASYFTPAEPADKVAGAIESFTVDAKGYCNPPAKSAGPAPQLLILGGSVPSCAGVDAASVFTSQLANVTGLSTYDMTVGGVGPYEYVEVLRRDGLALKPTAVVMAFSEANDLRDCQRHEDHIAGRIRTSRNAREWGFPFSSSYALSFVKAGIQVTAKQLKASSVDDFTYTLTLGAKSQPMNIRNGDQDELQSARAVAEGKISPSLCEPALVDFVSLARKHGFKPIVMATPASYVVYEETLRYDDAKLGALMSGYGFAQRKWLAENAERIGYTFVDPVPAMKKIAETAELLYFPSNAHLTIAGHRALAETIAPLIMKAINATP